MTINLSKGQREALTTKQFTVGLGWQENLSDTGADYDLDVSIFVLNANGKLISEEYFVFYNNLKSPDGAIEHKGDSLTGGQAGDDGDEENIIMDLAKINPQASEIRIVVTVHEAQQRGQNFGQVRNSYVRIIDTSNGNELMKFELDEDFSVETSVEFGRVYKRNDEWRFEASGIGTKESLQDSVDKFL